MRILFWFLLLAAAAVGVALAMKIGSGYALFVAPPYRVELSLNLLAIALVAGFVGAYILLRVVRRAMDLPNEVRSARRRMQLERARAKHDAAVIALLEGRYGRTRKLAEEALSIPQSTGLAALVGARAAMETRDFDAAGVLLSRADAQVSALAVPRLMLEAEIKLAQRQPIEALAVLRALKKEAGMHTAALRLELRALQGAGRYAEIPALVDQLVKRKAYGADEAEHVRAAAHAGALGALRGDAAGLRAYWNKLSEGEQRQPRIARAAAESFLALGADRDAAEILAQSLDRHWDPAQVELFAQCRAPDSTWQLEQAERWLQAHDRDATLLHALGTLCLRQQLWGKAQTYLEASLALAPSHRVHLALGELFGRLGRDAEANAQFTLALRMAVDELDRQHR